MWKQVSVIAAGFLVVFCLVSSLASAIEINGYSPARHDRFSSGYPSVPVANANSNFIGLGYDWSGVGWNPSNTVQSVALLGPGFFLYANHYPVGSSLQFVSSDGQLKSYNVNTSAASGAIDNNSSDLGIGALTSPIPASDHVNYYPIRFLGYSASSYDSNFYNGISGYNKILVYGRQGDASNNGPRIGMDTITNVENGITFGDGSVYTGKYFYYAYDTTTPDLAHLEVGDSGSPSFYYNSSTHQLYLAGAHFAATSPATASGYAIDSALPLMLNYVNAYMAQTGYLPYVVTPSTATWNGANGQWGNSGNWSLGEGTSVITEDTLDGSGQVITCASLVFDGSAGAASHSINLGGAQRTVTGITFKSAPGANAFTFIPGGSGGSLRIGEAGIVNNDDDAQILNCNIVLRSSQRWNVGLGGLSVSGSIDTDTGDLLLIEGGGNATLSGVISGSGGIAKDGTGTLILGGSSNNIYTGKTFVNGGTLKLGNASAMGAATTDIIVTGAGTLNLNGFSPTLGSLSGQGSVSLSGGNIAIGANNNNTTFSGTISGAGQLAKIGAGTLTLAGSNAYVGQTTISAGVLCLGNASAIPGGIGSTGGTSALAFNGGVLGLAAGDFTRLLGTGIDQVQFLDSGGFAAYGADRAVNLGGNGAPLQVTWGAGSFVLNGSTLILGASTADKTLNFQNPIDLGSSSRTIQVDDGSAFEDARLNGILSGSGGGLMKTGAGLLTLNAANSYSGITAINAGTLQIGSGGTTGFLGAGSVNDNASLAFNRSDTITVSNIINGSGNLQQLGSGTLILTGANGYLGTTTISSGMLQIGNGTAAGSLGAGAVTDNASLVFNRSDAITVSNNINGSGNLQQLGSGTLILTGANAYSGTTITNGAIQIGNGTAAGSLGAGAVTDNASLVFNRSGAITVSNIINGSGNLQQKGPGTLILSGANGYSGSTTVTSGILQLANPSALGTPAGGTIVQNGGALDLNGLSIGAESLTIFGLGTDGIGALVNTNTMAAALSNGPVILGGNAGAGGAGNITLNGPMIFGSFNFTKNGSGTLNLAGSLVWGSNSLATVQAGTLSYQPAVGASATVGAITPTLHITPGAVVNVDAAHNDPFTDSNTPTRHVTVVNDASGGFNITAGTVSLVGISGSGSTSILDGATLYTNYITQGQLTIGAGSTVVINAIGGSNAPQALSTSPSSLLPVSGLESLNTAAISPLAPLSESIQSNTNMTESAPVFNGGLSLVPEPSTWILILIAALCLLFRYKRN